MKLFGAAGVTLSVLAALTACSGSEPAAGSAPLELDQEEAALVAAVAVSDDASEDTASPLGPEPFWVKGCGFGAIREQLRERFDTDGDGRLGDGERAAIAAEFGDPLDRVALLLDLYDGDESGALDASELGELQADVEARCERREAALLERFDTDGDGALSDEERRAARASLGPGFGRGRALGLRDAGPPGGRRGEARRARAAERFDTDGDGRLGRDERRAFAGHMRGCVRGEHPVEPVDPGDDDAATPDAGAN